VRRGRRAGLLVLVALYATQARALDTGPPELQSDAPELRRDSGPGIVPGVTDAPDVAPIVPPAAPSAPPTPASGIAFFAREYRFEGNTIFTQAELAAVAAPFAGRDVTNADLAALRRALTLHYVERGYVNSGATIPDQAVADGVVVVRIVEGTLERIDVSGTRRLRPQYVESRLRAAAGPPLNVAVLQDQIQLLLSGPFVARFNGELAPGSAPGAATLHAKIEEKSPYSVVFGVNNDLTPTLGDVRGLLQGALLNPLGVGDVASAELAYADGSREAQVGYLLPLGLPRTSLEAFADWSKGEVVDERLRDLAIEGETTTLGARVNHLLRETAREQLGLAFGFDSRQSTTSLLGRGFAFSPGVEADGDSRVSVLRFVQHWTRRDPLQVFAVRSTFSVGLDAFGATRNVGALPDGRFVAWLGQAQWARRLPWRSSQLVFRLDGQYAADPLLPLEQFSIGGGRTVRGYARNVLVRDHGFATSLEWRVPVWRARDGRSLLELAPFVDAGGAWFEDRAGPAPDVIPALGLGLRSNPLRGTHAELYWGHALKEIPGAGDSPQEDGIYFALSADLFR